MDQEKWKEENDKHKEWYHRLCESFGPDIAKYRQDLWNYGEIYNVILDLRPTPQTKEMFDW